MSEANSWATIMGIGNLIKIVVVEIHTEVETDNIAMQFHQLETAGSVNFPKLARTQRNNSLVSTTLNSPGWGLYMYASQDLAM